MLSLAGMPGVASDQVYAALILTRTMTAIDEHCLLFIRGTGPLGYPGSAEVVNMQPPDALIQKGITSLPCIGDGRQSGTSGSPSILHASPEAAAGGGLALLRTDDRVRIDLGRRSANILISSAELEARRSAAGPFPIPQSQTPWQEIYRRTVGQLDTGACVDLATGFVNVIARYGEPRHSH